MNNDKNCCSSMLIKKEAGNHNRAQLINKAMLNWKRHWIFPLDVKKNQEYQDSY